MAKNIQEPYTKVNNEKKFATWLVESCGFAVSTQRSYIGIMRKSKEVFKEEYGQYAGVFEINDSKEFARIFDKILNSSKYEDFDKVGRFSSGMRQYKTFLDGKTSRN